MTTELVNRVFPALIRFGSRPGAALLVAAAIADGSFLLFAWLAVRATGSPFAWLLFAGAAALALVIALFAWRRRRLAAHRAEAVGVPAAQRLSPGVVAGSGAPSDRLDEELSLLQEVQWGGSLRPARYFPRIEATQRALVRAAGGTVNAPYLKDDLRVTLVALLGTMAAIPLASFGTILSLLVLALR